MDAIDVSGYVRDYGTLMHEVDQVGEPALDDALHGFLPGHANNNLGPFTSMMDNTSSGMFDTFKNANEIVVASIALGIRAAPASGDPVYAGEFELKNFLFTIDADTAVSAEFNGSTRATSLLYPNPWGNVIHAKAAKTAANTGTSDHDSGAQSTFGGYMVYHLFTSNGTCTLKVQDASTNTNPSFSDLLTSGVIDASATPAAAFVALATTATVERYTRWQLLLGTATTATFFISFHRGKAVT
jgi:hypothetical protein